MGVDVKHHVQLVLALEKKKNKEKLKKEIEKRYKKLGTSKA